MAFKDVLILCVFDNIYSSEWRELQHFFKSNFLFSMKTGQHYIRALLLIEYGHNIIRVGWGSYIQIDIVTYT